MKYEKCCRNCEYAYLTSKECKGCATFGDNKYENFKLRDELAKNEKGTLVELPCKVGDAVWVVYQDNETFENCIKESIAIEFIVMAGYIGIHVPKLYGNYQEVYATREQAEARLAELKGEK